jgi:cytochrome b561
MAKRYDAVAATLHWLMALAILALIPIGWWMADAVNDPATQQAAYRTFQIHKSVGLTVLALAILRLGWRLMHPPPPLPANLPAWQAITARATQWAFYAIMIAAPLTGWIYVSAGWAVGPDQPLKVATSYFGLFQVPHLFALGEAAETTRREVAHQSMTAHGRLAWAALILAALHAGAALKHHFVDRDDTLATMVPFLKLRGGEAAGKPPGSSALALGLGAIALVIAASWWLGTPQPRAPAPTAAAIAVEGAPLTPAAPLEAPPGENPAADAAPAVASARPESAPAAEIARWTVNPGASSIRFSGTHAGAAFTGRFERWTAEIRFDPQNLAASRARVTIATASARTGDATQEGSLAEAEWFNPKAFPDAVFETRSFKSLGGDRYEATGTLTIKGQATPVTLPFMLKIDGASADMQAKLTLDRTKLDLGLASDAAGEWVSKEIAVTIAVKATRTG